MSSGWVGSYAGKVAGAVFAAVAMAALSATADARSLRIENLESEEVAETALSGTPVMAIVSLKDQRVSIYDATGKAMRARVSSGQTGYETPVGIYSVLEKEEEHYSNVYDDASMPFMQRITWSGVALHAGALPGYPASHGCVRLPYEFAQELFPLTRIGMRVIVARDDVAPSEFSHPLLLKPLPAPPVAAARAIPANYENDASDNDGLPIFQPDVSRWPARQAQLMALQSEAAVKQSAAETAASNADDLRGAVRDKTIDRAKALKSLRRAEFVKRNADDRAAKADRALADAKSQAAVTSAMAAKEKAASGVKDAETALAAANEVVRTAEEELAKAKETWTTADAARAAAVEVADQTKRKMFPVSVFVSLKTQRLYVRQGHQPVFDTPVTIADPDKPIGTYIFTAVDYKNDGKDLRWTVVSLARRQPGDVDPPSRKGLRVANLSADAPTADVGGASAALDRITFPPEVAARISGYVWPGSSMIVSDEETSKETNKSTDFIVLISGEPQGGIKKRPRQPTPSFRDDPFYDGYRYDSYGRRYYKPGKSFFTWW